MFKIDIKNRFKNPNFYLRIVIIALPTLIAYMSANDLTSWESVGNSLLAILSNPLLLATTLVAIYHSFTSTINKVVEEEEQPTIE